MHISTDCVFNGAEGLQGGRPPDAEDLYGATKVLGEVTASRTHSRCGLDDRPRADRAPVSLLDWVLAQQGRTDQRLSQAAFYSGVTTNELARWSAG